MGLKEEVSKKIKLFESISRQLSNQKMTLTEEARKIEEQIRAREQGKDQEVVGEGEGSSSDSRVANEVVANQRSIENSVTEHASSTSDPMVVGLGADMEEEPIVEEKEVKKKRRKTSKKNRKKKQDELVANKEEDSSLVDSVDYVRDTTGADTPASDQFGPETFAHSALDD